MLQQERSKEDTNQAYSCFVLERNHCIMHTSIPFITKDCSSKLYYGISSWHTPMHDSVTYMCFARRPYRRSSVSGSHQVNVAIGQALLIDTYESVIRCGSQACTSCVTWWRVRVTNVAMERQYSVCVCVCVCVCMCVCVSVCLSVTLVTQNAKHMRRITLSSAACLALPYFSTLSHKRHDFRKKNTRHEMCVLILSTTFV